MSKNDNQGENKSPKTRSQKKRLRDDNKKDEIDKEKSNIGMKINKKKKTEEKKRVPLITLHPFPLAEHIDFETTEEEEDSDEFIEEEGSDGFIDDEEESYQESGDEEDFPSKKALLVYGKNPNMKKKVNDLTEEEMVKSEMYSEEEFNYFEKMSKEDRALVLLKQDEVEKYHKKETPFRFDVLMSGMPLSMKSIIIEKLDQLGQMQGYESEYFKLMKWVNGISKMPINNYIKMPFDVNSSVENLLENKDALNFLKNANSIMKKSTYGHDVAKDRIIQVITKWISNPTSKGNVIAFQGPPGIGKTSLARDGIAKAIGRPFCFLALGGATDASFLEGFSFTYEGSQWGRICQMLMDAKCMNPVIFMDELDKISQSDKGNEIAGLLTHITDGSQNEEFEDRYFAGVKIDLSKALFIFSYNDSSLINPILKDRITEIRLEGYKKEEKIIIAKDYSIPELLKSVGFKKDEILFDDEILGYIIENYTDEDGVRSLRRCIETILMKINVYRFLKDDADELNYQINNFSIPFNISKEIVDLLLPEMKDKTGKLSESAQSIYL